jgi:hypothetical protein
MKKIFYAIQIPYEPKYDYNYGFTSLETLVQDLSFNYGMEFQVVGEGFNKETGEQIRYLADMRGNLYARIVEIKVV